MPAICLQALEARFSSWKGAVEEGVFGVIGWGRWGILFGYGKGRALRGCPPEGRVAGSRERKRRSQRQLPCVSLGERTENSKLDW